MYMLNLSRCKDRNGRRNEDEELGNPFFEGDCSSFNEWGDYGVAGDDYERAPVFDDDYEEASVFDDDQFEEESMPVYDTDIKDVIEEEEGFVGKGGFGEEEENMEGIVVVANDLCSSMIQTTLNVDFEKDINTKSHELMSFGKRELGSQSTDDEDAYEHLQRVLEITNLFHIPGVTRDTVMLRVSPITLTGAAKRWKNMLPVGSISTWDLLEKAFIMKFCPPLKTAKKLEEIRNFKQGVDETLYQAWERYNDLLFRCPQYDLNNHQKVQIFYKGLEIPSRKMVDSQGLIPRTPPAQALKSIQIMVDHSQNWYNGATAWQGGSNNSNDIAVITKRVDSLGRDM
ncbi:ribonuclease H-like domain-containing protein [Tanacetum coccineum]